MNSAITTYIIDAFTDAPFKGNPAGVCILDEPLSDQSMQSIATELGLSETAFVLKNHNNYRICYFSPKMEIPLCGHATLASAQALFSTRDALEHIHFVTRQKLDLNIYRENEWIVMDFPVYETVPADAPQALLEALGLSEVQHTVYNHENQILMLEIADSQELAKLKPDFPALVKTHDKINGVLVTAPSHREGYDFESRYFWPWSGTDEDPVTGATHTFMAPYWGAKLGKVKLKSFQASRRTGFMELELLEDRLLIRGLAQIVLEGKITA